MSQDKCLYFLMIILLVIEVMIFQEVLIGSHEITGKAWDLWLGTKEGQELAANWQLQQLVMLNGVMLILNI